MDEKKTINEINKMIGITLKRVSGPLLHKYDTGYHICVDILCITNKNADMVEW